MKSTPLLEAYDWEQYERVIVLSPHLDDASLSCAGLLTALEGKVERLVVTISGANPPPRDDEDAQARSRVRRGFAAPALRRQEDIASMRELRCDFVHLGFADCIDRRSPTSGELIYRSQRVRWLQPSLEDAAHIEELYLVLRRLCGYAGKALVVSPLGVGFHVDHRICAESALRIARRIVHLLFYEDFPYVIYPSKRDGMADTPEAALERLSLTASKRYHVTYDPDAKERAIAPYATQIPLLFENVESLREGLRQRTHDGVPAETYWKPKLATGNEEGRAR
ncbi:MAG: PIG-L family deacetylase [Myxococcales bacterium]|nr:PIG-L family deacetylase [Myxococcales bacterium]